jgi:predicted Rossmann-fold nucleotide-binding protein
MPKVPVILVGSYFWNGLEEWMKKSILGEKCIDGNDLHLYTIVDDPQDVVKAVNAYYKKNKAK